MNNYKGFEIEQHENNFIIYFSDDFGDNGVFNSLEELKIYVDKKLIIDESNKIFRAEQKERENKKIMQKNEDEKNLNLYLDKFKEGLKKERVKHFLLSNMKTRYNLEGSFKYSYSVNYKQIENLNKVGRIAELDEISHNGKDKIQYIAKDKIKGYFVIKKLEYDYLKFLNDLGLKNE